MTRILIVDDLNFIRQALQTLLAKETNLEIVAQVNNGIEALKYLASERVDIVIADLEMPEMDGLTLTERVSQSFPEIEVIIFSSHDDALTINAAIVAGAKGYISKNTTTEELLNTIRNVRRGYFQLGPGLFEKSFAYLLAQQQLTTDCIAQFETYYQDNVAQLEEKYDRVCSIKRQELFSELDYQIDNLKTEFRHGLEIFQSRVNEQVQAGLNEVLKFNDNPNTLGQEIRKQVESQNIEHHLYLKNLYITTRESVKKLEHQLFFTRYLVIFLGVVLLIEHLVVLIW